jgi:hypothetical protein
VELSAETRFLSIVIPDTIPADVTAVPAVGQNGSPCIFSGLEQGCDIVGAVVNAFSIVGPAGIKALVGDAPAVDVDIKPSQGV